jgi:hypothetical protein
LLFLKKNKKIGSIAATQNVAAENVLLAATTVAANTKINGAHK